MNFKLLRATPLIVMLLLSVAMAAALLHGNPSAQSGESRKDYSIGAFDIPTLDNKRFSPAIWQGKVSMLNVFASWCETCGLEHETVMKIAQTNKVVIYGLAWKDTPEKAARWLNERGNPYRSVGIDEYGQSTVALALTGVPETFVFDKNGRIAYHYNGVLTDNVVSRVIMPLVEKLDAK